MITCAVITGGHHFDVIGFHKLFRELPGVDAYLQHMEDFVTSSAENKAAYNVLIFYTQLKDELNSDGAAPGGSNSIQVMLESLKDSKQGILLLHHSLLALPGWDSWNALVGMDDRTLETYAHDELVDVQITDPTHPITAGLNDWTMTDETYLMPDAKAADGNHILLTTTHPQNAKTLAWTRQVHGSRVCCLQLGHDADSWKDANFRQVLGQAIAWCAG